MKLTKQQLKQIIKEELSIQESNNGEDLPTPQEIEKVKLKIKKMKYAIKNDLVTTNKALFDSNLNHIEDVINRLALYSK